jgi:hypothetical protein
VAQSLDEWLQQNSDRVLARQRAHVDTAKVLVSITLAVAATMVATALQVEPVKGMDVAAGGVLAGSFVATVGVILLDRLKEPNRHLAQDKAQRGKWSDEQLLGYLREQALDTEDENRVVVYHVHIATAAQILSSSAAGVIAALSLLM